MTIHLQDEEKGLEKKEDKTDSNDEIVVDSNPPLTFMKSLSPFPQIFFQDIQNEEFIIHLKDEVKEETKEDET